MVLSSAYGMMTHVFPILVASPRYFAGAISLGVLMQVGSAFYEVTRALTWFMLNYPRVADWISHVERVAELEDSLDEAARLARRGAIAVEEGPAADGTEALRFQGLSVAAPDGRVLVRRADAVIRPGERVLIQGESGTGKSTLFRAVAGAWPWGSGSIRVPERGAAMFLPQRPYLPLGSLADALAYPAPASAFQEAAMGAALARCGLARLVGRLDERARWDRTLSLGEQQRLAFARVLLHRPRWVFLDEATAALDEVNQDSMMRLLREELPASAVVSIGHRPGLDRYHDRVLTLRAAPGGAVLADGPDVPRAEPDAVPPARDSGLSGATASPWMPPRRRGRHPRFRELRPEAPGRAGRASTAPAQHQEHAQDRLAPLLPQGGLVPRHDAQAGGRGEQRRMGGVVPIAHGRAQGERRALAGFEREGRQAARPQGRGDAGQGRPQIAEVVEDVGGGDQVECARMRGQPFDQVGQVQRGIDAAPARLREHARREVEAF
jgi:energy-coupling factor transporter ATP-binding protein EcfA2